MEASVIPTWDNDRAWRLVRVASFMNVYVNVSGINLFFDKSNDLSCFKSTNESINLFIKFWLLCYSGKMAHMARSSVAVKLNSAEEISRNDSSLIIICERSMYFKNLPLCFINSITGDASVIWFWARSNLLILLSPSMTSHILARSSLSSWLFEKLISLTN